MPCSVGRHNAAPGILRAPSRRYTCIGRLDGPLGRDRGITSHTGAKIQGSVSDEGTRSRQFASLSWHNSVVCCALHRQRLSVPRVQPIWTVPRDLRVSSRVMTDRSHFFRIRSRCASSAPTAPILRARPPERHTLEPRERVACQFCIISGCLTALTMLADDRT